MTEFCENCPMRDSATGQLIATLSGPSSARGRFSGEVFSGVAGVFVDTASGISKPMAMPDTQEGRELLYPLIDDCAGPMTEQRGVFKKHEIVTGCSALGELAISESILVQRFIQTAKAEALNVVANMPPELKGE